jgi:hypothetical protein
MLQTAYLLDHIDALLRLSHDVKDRAVSEELRAMADELRIMVSVADITGFAATLNKSAATPAPDLAGATAVPSRTPEPTQEVAKDQPLWFSAARHAGLDRAMACTRVGAP